MIFGLPHAIDTKMVGRREAPIIELMIQVSSGVACNFCTAVCRWMHKCFAILPMLDLIPFVKPAPEWLEMPCKETIF